MKITEVRIFPAESRDGKLKAFATMTFDDWFVVRNVKVIQGNSGLFVAMPSRKIVDPCPKCRFKNARGSRYCNQCGAEIGMQGIPAEHTEKKETGNHMDIAHPITQECRVYIQDRILEAYNAEKQTPKPEESPYKPETGEDLDVGADSPASEEKQPEQQANAGITDVAGDDQDIAL